MTIDPMNHGECLTEETLTDYLEGALDPAVKAGSEAHLVACDSCRIRLAYFMRLLNQDVEPEESAALAIIQEEWTKRHRDRRLPNQRGDWRRWKIASGGVAAALLIALGSRVAIDRIGEPRSANEVLQLLLAENRPFEARISGQPYRPFTATRGPADAGSTPSSALLAGQMMRLSATAYEMGQFHLLHKDFVKAIGYLEAAERERDATAGMHNDLGVAYMESGNLQKAVVEFRHALAEEPYFAPAVFNLAVLFERMGRTDQAQSQWNDYLGLDSNSGWLAEAKSKLEVIKH
jgi:tetratricopeptide (TPR) repeat protein